MLRSLFAFVFSLLAAQSPAQEAGHVAEIAPAYIERELTAIGYLTTSRPPPGGRAGIGGCSATLIAPNVLLTAAHCAANRVSRPQDLFITFGWRDDGPPVWRSSARSVHVPANYVDGRYHIDTLHHDVAFVVLPRAVPADLVTPIPLDPGFGVTLDTASGTEPLRYSLYGFPRGEPTLLRGHDSCAVVQVREALIGTNCPVQAGFSGAPLLRRSGEELRVAGVIAAHVPGDGTDIQTFVVIPPEDLQPNQP